MVNLSPKELETIFSAQKLEISEYLIYEKLSQLVKDEATQKVLARLGSDSLKHYHFWQKITGKEAKVNTFRVWWYLSLARFFGITFCIRSLEDTERSIGKIYEGIAKFNKEFSWIIAEEKEHEEKVISLIDEDLLKYVSSIVLGSNDALVELTGTLAGLTLALQNNRLIGATGLITGLAASFSMASSEYLSTKSEKGAKTPLKAAFYTGITYVCTVLLLIFPYFLSRNYFLSLFLTLLNAFLIIMLFSFYIAVTQHISFKKRFLENFSLSFGIAFLSFVIGFLVRTFLKIEV